MKEITNHAEVNCMICHFKIQILAGFIWESIKAFFPIICLPTSPARKEVTEISLFSLYSVESPKTP